MAETTTKIPDADAAESYRLDGQIGFLLRRASQRHIAIFSRLIPELTPTQFAVIARAFEIGPASQAELGRATAMDAATVKGVIDRLRVRGLLATEPSAEDRRRVVVQLTAHGRQVYAGLTGNAVRISAETVAPLSAQERVKLLQILEKIC